MAKYRKTLLYISFVIFIVLGILVFKSDRGIIFDVWILNWIKESLSIRVVSFMGLVSFLGSETFLFPIMAMVISYFLIKKSYYISVLLLASSLGSFIVNYLLKAIFQRTRPLEYFLVEQAGLSYPSGHTMVSTTMFLTFAYIYSRGKSETKKKYAYTLALIYILLMGISRVSLGVHWPTDIIGGLLGGYIFYELLILKIPKKILKKR
ncbi:MAG: phosphatase PAP2 family protein [Gudongella sp.]|nr:phosphatase PAP2 family protein [Gudongella sp.]